eukprot:10617688-Lingulodinium_polyedra.AAC.1
MSWLTAAAPRPPRECYARRPPSTAHWRPLLEGQVALAWAWTAAATPGEAAALPGPGLGASLGHALAGPPPLLGPSAPLTAPVAREEQEAPTAARIE